MDFWLSWHQVDAAVLAQLHRSRVQPCHQHAVGRPRCKVGPGDSMHKNAMEDLDGGRPLKMKGGTVVDLSCICHSWGCPFRNVRCWEERSSTVAEDKKSTSSSLIPQRARAATCSSPHQNQLEVDPFKGPVPPFYTNDPSPCCSTQPVWTSQVIKRCSTGPKNFIHKSPYFVPTPTS